eukprot:gnl/Chilomastix_cuspidata/1069.p1 GENE.gnl/Chilomastix_cuspidata/1069~~gnl/Chilomastix_cuspidata/1069.p1  ORF type:complete len:184 (-),score=19.51 gnl/Chilomastix_cuspidata/1069:135-686(-)
MAAEINSVFFFCCSAALPAYCPVSLAARQRESMQGKTKSEYKIVPLDLPVCGELDAFNSEEDEIFILTAPSDFDVTKLPSDVFNAERVSNKPASFSLSGEAVTVSHVEHHGTAAVVCNAPSKHTTTEDDDPDDTGARGFETIPVSHELRVASRPELEDTHIVATATDDAQRSFPGFQNVGFYE